MWEYLDQGVPTCSYVGVKRQTETGCERAYAHDSCVVAAGGQPGVRLPPASVTSVPPPPSAPMGRAATEASLDVSVDALKCQQGRRIFRVHRSRGPGSLYNHDPFQPPVLPVGPARPGLLGSSCQ